MGLQGRLASCMRMWVFKDTLLVFYLLPDGKAAVHEDIGHIFFIPEEELYMCIGVHGFPQRQVPDGSFPQVFRQPSRKQASSCLGEQLLGRSMLTTSQMCSCRSRTPSTASSRSRYQWQGYVLVLPPAGSVAPGWPAESAGQAAMRMSDLLRPPRLLCLLC